MSAQSGSMRQILDMRPHWIVITFLPAISLDEKGSVLEGSEICRILPSSVSGSAVKNRDRQTRPQFWASATCGFVSKKPDVLGGFRFFPALPKYTVNNPLPRSENTTTSSSREYIKGPLSENRTTTLLCHRLT